MPASAGALDDKVYQVCKKWRVDQGGWMPTEDMQYCRTVLFCATLNREVDREYCKKEPGNIEGGSSVDSNARIVAKACLQDGNC